jgi:glycosyltransferase involved in cell wall biosynthesis
MRRLDLDSINDIDVFIANSTVTQERIKTYYHKPSTIVYPPVNVDRFTPPPRTDRHGYIVWGRHVPYKRFDLAIQACNQLKADLVVIGNGPDTDRLKKIAGPTIHFTGRVSDEELVNYAQHAKAFLMPNEEDFGIAAVEALAAGTPVIGYKKGGVIDIVDEQTGVLFDEQTVDSLVDAMKRSETISFLPATLHRRAKRFDKSLFATKIRKIVGDQSTRP